MIERKIDEVIYFELEGFGDEKVKHSFSSRIGWDQKNIFKGIEKIYKVEDKNIYRAKQVHGDKVLIIKDQENKKISNIEVDGFITDRKNIVLATYHADCVPLYFYDKQNGVIGVGHSGWRGTLKNIAKNILDIMIYDYNSDINDIEVGIGPSICVDCYEVQKDVSNLFIEKFGEDIVKKVDGKLYLNLWLANEKNLKSFGILDSNIYMSNYCTSCNLDKLYSYRKEKGTNGRMITGIMLLDK